MNRKSTAKQVSCGPSGASIGLTNPLPASRNFILRQKAPLYRIPITPRLHQQLHPALGAEARQDAALACRVQSSFL